MIRFIFMRNISRSIPVFFILSYFIFSASSCNKEVSVTPPDSPPPNGYLFVDSNPKGFQIYLNNKERRRATPDSLTWLSTGTYLVTLKKDLFRDSSFSIDAVEGQKRKIYVDYTKNPSMRGSIYCTSNPTNADIFINDSSTGLHTPATIKVMPGNYFIKYHSKNCRDDSMLAFVSSGKTTPAKLALVDTTIWQDFTTSNSGIKSNNLSCVAVDKNNIIWVGSFDNGYFSFDGTTWRVYYNSFGAVINCINIDANNIKYVGTFRGLVVIYSGTSTVEYGPMSSGLPDFHINALTFDNEGKCYIGTNKSITQFPGWADYTPILGEISSTVWITSLVTDLNNNIWAGIKDSGIVKVTSQKKDIFYLASSSGLINNKTTALAVSPTGEIWAGFDNNSVFGNGLSYFDGTNWNKVYPIPSSSRTNTIFIDKNNVKWVGTNQGLFTFSSPSNVTAFNYDNTGLNMINVRGISQDSFGNIWIATSSGLYKYKGGH